MMENYLVFLVEDVEITISLCAARNAIVNLKMIVDHHITVEKVINKNARWL